MNWNRIKGKWLQFRGAVRSEWGQLTDDDFSTIAGERDKLLGKLQERYGLSRPEAEASIEAWIISLAVQPDDEQIVANDPAMRDR